MWTDSTTLLQWLNLSTKHPLFVANRVSEILEHTSVDESNHVASSDNSADADTRGVSAEILQSSCWVDGPDFLRTKHFPFALRTELVNNIKPGITTKENDNSNTSLVESAIKEPPPQLISFASINSVFIKKCYG